MSAELPQRIEPFRLAVKGSTLAGTLKTAGMPRLREAVRACDEAVELELHFGRDQEGRARISGWVRGRVTLVCQRCLAAMPWELEAAVMLAPVRGERAMAALPGECEPLLVEDETTGLSGMIEDELLLALPMAPMHEHACAEPVVTPAADATGEVEKPFAVLGRLRRKPS